jgi:glycosyltransferase involved in cell wall biosynthesis
MNVFRRPSFVFVASRFHPWHGLDLLLDSLSRSNLDIVLYIIGNTSKEDSLTIESLIGASHYKISHFAYLAPDSLAKLYAECHLGISSLALTRNNMFEACPLKSREYLRFGLPVAGNYIDNEVANPFYQRVSPSIDSIYSAFRRVSSISKANIAQYASMNLSRSAYLARLN